MVKANREFDTTYLSIDLAEKRGFIHRDYIAHCLRWSHIAKAAHHGKYKEHRWLDIGCGRDQPLARLLYTNKMAPTDGYYIGVELNKMEVSDVFKSSSWKPIIFGELNATTQIQVLEEENILVGSLKVKRPTHVVCLEVLEHMKPKHCLRLIKKFAELAKVGATIYTSTPCYSEHVGAAENHINEITYEALGALFEDNGLEIVDHWGTFASQIDYKKFMIDGQKEVFDALAKYYDSNLVSNIMAPMFPSKSRNVLWVLKTRAAGASRQFQTIKNVNQPWSSSSEYIDLAGNET